MTRNSRRARVGLAAGLSLALGALGGPALGSSPEGAAPADLVYLYDLNPQTAPGGTTVYTFSFSQDVWAVVAVRPRSGEPTLALYDGEDRAASNQLAKSNLPGDAIEFTVVYDPLSGFGESYYPHVKSKGGRSQVELSEALYQLRPGQSPEDHLALGSVVRIHPLENLRSGFDYTLTAGGPDSGDIDMYLMAKPAESGVVALSRSQAIATAESQPAGGTESLTFTADDLQAYALIITQESGNGDVVVSLSTAG